MSGGNGLLVGNTTGLTGRLTILNGKMIGDMTLGGVTASTGFFTIGADALFDAQNNSIAVGNSGNGTLTVVDRGRYTGNANLLVGNLNGSNGSVIVSGYESSINNNSGGITIGSLGVGSMTVTDQATVSGAVVSLGDTASGSGSLTISGAGSMFTNNGNFNVGNLGLGDLLVSDGGTLTTTASRLAAAASSTGTAKITGAGSTWNASSLAIGGVLGTNAGTGTLRINDGGAVNVSGNAEIRGSLNTSLTIDGGSLAVSGSFTRIGTLNLLDGTLHVTGAFDNGAFSAPLSIDGITPDALPTLQLSSSSGTLLHVTTITVGSVNRGALVLDTGRQIAIGPNALSIGATASGNGSVTVTSGSSLSTTTGSINVGGNAGVAQGIGALTVSQGGAVITTSGTFNVFPLGTLTIDNGTVSAPTLSISSGATVNFLRGRVNLTALNANLTSAVADGLLGTTHELGANRTIGGGAGVFTIQTPLTINGGTLTSGSSGPLTNASTLVVNSGILNADATLTNDPGRILQVSGTGAVTATSFLNSGTLLLNNNLVPIGGGTLTNSGVIRGTGIVANVMSNPVAGQIQASAGNRLEFTNATFNNSGIISVSGGEFALTVGMNNNTNGLISGQNGVIRGGTSGILNAGAMAFSAGSMDLYGDVTQQTGGRITITGGGVTTFYDDVTINAGANNIQVSATGGVVSSVVFLGSYNGGTTGGGGAFIEGDHRPGNSPALVSFGGDVFYGAGSKLNVELGGTARGSQYDAVDVAGTVTLSGALNATTINGFVPTIGNSFTLLNAAGVTGKFTSATLPSLSGGQWGLSYNANSVVLGAFLQGDYNHNGVVDAPDYVIWRKTLGQTAVGLAADGNGNGAVDAADFNVWRTQFGKPPGSGSALNTLSSAAVPEPATIALMLLALTFVIKTRAAGFIPAGGWDRASVSPQPPIAGQIAPLRLAVRQ